MLSEASLNARDLLPSGGVPEEVLMDNFRALVLHHDAASRSVQFKDKLIASRGIGAAAANATPDSAGALSLPARDMMERGKADVLMHHSDRDSQCSRDD
jgi:hypothetical protein